MRLSAILWGAQALAFGCRDGESGAATSAMAGSTSVQASSGTKTAGTGGAGGANADALFAVAVATDSADATISLVLMKNGDVWGFGDNASGRCLGWPGGLKRRVERCLISDMKTLFVRNDSAGGLRFDGKPAIWGGEPNEQFGDGQGIHTPYDTAHVVDEVTDAIDFFAPFGWAVQRDGAAYYWGIRGAANEENFPTPQFVPKRWLEVPPATVSMRGNSIACALSAAGELRMWGANPAGNLGDGTTNDTFGVVPSVPVLTGVRTMPGCGVQNCAVTHSNEVYCWGAGKWGQLGDGRSDLVGADDFAPIQTTPKRVVGLPPIVGISNSPYATSVCAWTEVGDVYCWGWNIAYPGFGSNSPYAIPKQLQGISDVVDVAFNQSHMVFVKRDGTVWTAGSDKAALGREDWATEEVGQVFFVPEP